MCTKLEALGVCTDPILHKIAEIDDKEEQSGDATLWDKFAQVNKYDVYLPDAEQKSMCHQPFNPSGGDCLKYIFEASGSTFDHHFQFKEGNFSFTNSIRQIDDTHFTQKFTVENGDQKPINVQCDIMYDGKMYDGKFFDFLDTSVAPVTD